MKLHFMEECILETTANADLTVSKCRNTGLHRKPQINHAFIWSMQTIVSDV